MSFQAAHAAEATPDHVTGVPWSTDLDGNGTTGLNDFAIFGCAFLTLSAGGPCPGGYCPYAKCGSAPCDPSCPLAGPPCTCGSGVAVWHSDFDCNGFVGLSDLVVMAQAYVTGTTHSGTCP